MSIFNWARSSKPQDKQALSTKADKSSKSRDGYYSHELDGDKKQEQADQKSDAESRRYDGGDIYQKGQRGKKEI